MAPDLIETVFKTVHGVDVGVDILLPADASPHKPLPIIVWWHGGGLLQGTRKSLPPHLKSAPETHRVCVVSADYRLAPQVRFPEIMADVSDLVRWLQTSDFKRASRGCADSSRVALSGSSAGGWLALLAGGGIGFEACGIVTPPRPKAVAALYPITHLEDEFWTTPQRPVSYLDRVIDGEKELGEFIDPKSPVVSSSARDSPRWDVYHWMIQEAKLESLLLEGTTVSPKEFSVPRALREGHSRLPPTFLIHPDIDEMVPIRQSHEVVDALRAIGCTHEFVTEVGKDHLYDLDPSENLEQMYAFLAKHLT